MPRMGKKQRQRKREQENACGRVGADNGSEAEKGQDGDREILKENRKNKDMAEKTKKKRGRRRRRCAFQDKWEGVMAKDNGTTQ